MFADKNPSLLKKQKAMSFRQELTEIKIDAGDNSHLKNHEAEHLTVLLTKLNSALDNLSFDEKKLGEYVLSTLPRSLDWKNWRALILYLNHINKVGVDATNAMAEKFTLLSATYRKILREIIKCCENYKPGIKISLGVHAIEDFDDLSERFAAKFKENKNEFAAACDAPLALAHLERNSRICLTARTDLRKHFLQWYRAAGKILEINSPQTPLIKKRKHQRKSSRLKKIVDFTIITICRNLSLTHIRETDIHTIKLLCKLYLTNFGKEPDNGIEIGNFKIDLSPHEFLHQRLHKFLAHLSAWITTLRPVHKEFNAAFIRIKDRASATTEVETFSSSVLRTGLGRPGCIVETYLDENDELHHSTYTWENFCYNANIPNIGPVSDLALLNYESSPNLQMACEKVSRIYTAVPFAALTEAKAQMEELEKTQRDRYRGAYSIPEREAPDQAELANQAAFKKGHKLYEEKGRELGSNYSDVFTTVNALTALGKGLITIEQALATDANLLNALFRPNFECNRSGLLSLEEGLTTIAEIKESKITPKNLKKLLNHENGLTLLRMEAITITQLAALSDEKFEMQLNNESLQIARATLRDEFKLILQNAILVWDCGGVYRLDIPPQYAKKRLFLIDFLKKETGVTLNDFDQCFADPDNSLSICIQSAKIKKFIDDFRNKKSDVAFITKQSPIFTHQQLVVDEIPICNSSFQKVSDEKKSDFASRTLKIT